MSSLALYALYGGNRLSKRLSPGSWGTYCFSDADLVFKANNGYFRQTNSVYALDLSCGSSYNSGKLEDDLSKGNPYLSLNEGSCWSRIPCTIREELLGVGNCVIKIRHRREPGTSIDIFLQWKQD